MGTPNNKQMLVGDEVVVNAVDQLPFSGKVVHFDDRIFAVTGAPGADGNPERRVYAHGTVRVQFIRRG